MKKRSINNAAFFSVILVKSNKKKKKTTFHLLKVKLAQNKTALAQIIYFNNQI